MRNALTIVRNFGDDPLSLAAHRHDDAAFARALVADRLHSVDEKIHEDLRQAPDTADHLRLAVHAERHASATAQLRFGHA